MNRTLLTLALALTACTATNPASRDPPDALAAQDSQVNGGGGGGSVPEPDVGGRGTVPDGPDASQVEYDSSVPELDAGFPTPPPKVIFSEIDYNVSSWDGCQPGTADDRIPRRKYIKLRNVGVDVVDLGTLGIVLVDGVASYPPAYVAPRRTFLDPDTDSEPLDLPEDFSEGPFGIRLVTEHQETLDSFRTRGVADADWEGSPGKTDSCAQWSLHRWRYTPGADQGHDYCAEWSANHSGAEHPSIDTDDNALDFVLVPRSEDPQYRGYGPGGADVYYVPPVTDCEYAWNSDQF